MSFCSIDLPLKVFAEFIGTMGLTLVVLMTSPSGNAAFVAGVYLAAAWYGLAAVSGCHVNPAVSVGVFSYQLIQGTCNGLAFPLYVIAQYCGNKT